jgi:hypothetical protein
MSAFSVLVSSSPKAAAGKGRARYACCTVPVTGALAWEPSGWSFCCGGPVEMAVGDEWERAADGSMGGGAVSGEVACMARD